MKCDSFYLLLLRLLLISDNFEGPETWPVFANRTNSLLSLLSDRAAPEVSLNVLALQTIQN